MRVAWVLERAAGSGIVCTVFTILPLPWTTLLATVVAVAANDVVTPVLPLELPVGVGSGVAGALRVGGGLFVVATWRLGGLLVVLLGAAGETVEPATPSGDAVTAVAAPFSAAIRAASSAST